MPTVVPQRELRPLASRALPIMKLRAVESSAIAAFFPTLVPKAGCSIAAYDT